MINTILLFILVLFAVFYVVKALVPDSKKSYFKRQLTNTNRQIWDYEFKVEKTMQIREGIRLDRDNLNDAKYRMEAEMKGKPNDKKLEEEHTKLLDTIKRYEAQIDMLDKQVNGVPANGDNPGEEGIANIISSLAELRSMYKGYISRL